MIVRHAMPPVKQLTERLSTPQGFLLATAVALSLGGEIPAPLLRVPLTVPLALFVPGYALYLIILGNGEHPALPTVAGSALLSLAAYPILLLLLSVLSIPITAHAILAEVDLLALTAILITSLTPPRAGKSLSLGVRGAVLPPALAAVTFALVCAGIWVSGHLLPASRSMPYTELYLTGRWARIPGVISAAGGRISVGVGARNATGKTETYLLALSSDGKKPVPAARMTIPTSRSWSGHIVAAVPRGGCLHRIELSLLDRHDKKPTPPLILWVVRRGSSPGVCARRAR